MDGQTDRRTDRWTDDRQSDPYVSLCFAGDTKISIKLIFYLFTTGIMTTASVTVVPRDELSSEKEVRLTDAEFFFFNKICIVWSIHAVDDTVCAGVYTDTLWPGQVKYVLLLLNSRAGVCEMLSDQLTVCPHNLCSTHEGDILVTSYTNKILNFSPRNKGDCREFTMLDSDEKAGGMVLTKDNHVMVAVRNDRKYPTIYKLSMDGTLIQRIDLTSAIQDHEPAWISNIKPYVDGKFILRYKDKIFTMDDKCTVKEIARLNDSWEIRSFCSDKHGHIICANEKGDIFLIDRQGHLKKQYQIAIKEKDKLRSIVVDSHCRLWLGVDGGVIRIASYIK